MALLAGGNMNMSDTRRTNFRGRGVTLRSERSPEQTLPYSMSGESPIMANSQSALSASGAPVLNSLNFPKSTNGAVCSGVLGTMRPTNAWISGRYRSVTMTRLFSSTLIADSRRSAIWMVYSPSRLHKSATGSAARLLPAIADGGGADKSPDAGAAAALTHWLWMLLPMTSATRENSTASAASTTGLRCLDA